MEQLADVLAELATRFGLAAEEVWPHVVYVTWLQAIINCVGGILLMALPGTLGIRWILHWYREKDGTYEQDEMKAPAIGGVVVGFILVFIGINFVLGSIPTLLDPIGGTVLMLLR